MKKLILLLLFTVITQAQETTMHFYYGTANTLGAEFITHVANTDSFYLGGGFGGVLTQNRYSGKAEKWCNIYASTSFGYINQIMIKERAGLAVYCKNGKEVTYKPMVGISGMYEITKDIGIEVGFDTFNIGTIGFTILF